MTDRPVGRWLTWFPPVAIALVVAAVVAVRGGDGDGGPGDEVARVEEAERVPPAETTPTTGFADRTPTLPDEPFDYTTNLPDHVTGGPAGVGADLDTAVAAPITDEGATLGRVLFYDVNLSANRTVRCASCHVQANGFTDPLTFSQGFAGFRTRRNSMPLANARFNPTGRFLWDEAAETLEAQVLMPFVDPIEMGLSEDQLIGRIEERPFYEPLFAAAFGDGDVTLERVADALAQFIRAMVSVGSRYDEGRAEVADPNDDFPTFTDAENEGKRLFGTPIADGGAGCSSCHATELQLTSPLGVENNGLDPPTDVFVPPDLGAFEVTGEVADIGRFRVPSLRNVAVTAPYMHDGRFLTLEQVIEHYDVGVQPHENLSPLLIGADGRPIRLGLTDAQRAALVAFLRTLTDEGFLTDERFSEPFRSG